MFVEEIYQVDNSSFAIRWGDTQTVDVFKLSTLQNACPCKRCLGKTIPLREDKIVRAVQISSVGAYALRIQFTSGCSDGIFTFNFLRDMAKRGASVT